MRIAQSGFAQFMATPAGRVVRIIAGLALLAWGFWGLQGTARVLVIVVGLVPLLAGLFDVCVISALLGGPFSGTAIRAAGIRTAK
jgi:hypothetical protein